LHDAVAKAEDSFAPRESLTTAGAFVVTGLVACTLKLIPTVAKMASNEIKTALLIMFLLLMVGTNVTFTFTKE